MVNEWGATLTSVPLKRVLHISEEPLEGNLSARKVTLQMYIILCRDIPGCIFSSKKDDSRVSDELDLFQDHTKSRDRCSRQLEGERKATFLYPSNV